LEAEPARLASSSKLRAGTHVFALGAPRGLELTITEGLVSAVRRFDREESSGLIQISAPISPGSSGGGLFDRRGRLVGITTSFVTGAQGLSFAIPNEAVASEAQAISYEHARLFALALASSESGEKERAVDLLQRVVRLQGDSSEGWLAFGYLQDDRAARIEAFQKAASASPDRPDAWGALGDNLCSLASDTEAQGEYGEPEGSANWVEEVRALRLRAVSALETAVKLEPSNAPFWQELGDLYQLLEDRGQADRAYREVLRLVPGHLEAMTDLCRVHAFSPTPAESIALCTEVIRHAQHQADSHDRTFALAQSWRSLAHALAVVRDTQGARSARAQAWHWGSLLASSDYHGPWPEIRRRATAREAVIKPLLPLLESRLRP
jgi:tetratricopeptide (TPR) repeat protein